MRTQIKIYTILALFSIFLALLVYMYSGEKQYKGEIKNYEIFVKSSSKLVQLQHKWSDKSEDKKLLKKIKSRFKPSSSVQKGNLQILDFNNLTKNNLNRIGKMLLNSDLTIKVIDLKNKTIKYLYM